MQGEGDVALNALGLIGFVCFCLLSVSISFGFRWDFREGGRAPADLEKVHQEEIRLLMKF